MKAQLLYNERIQYNDAAVAHIVVWQILQPLVGSTIATSTGLPMWSAMNACFATTTRLAKAITGILETRRPLTCSPPATVCSMTA